MLNEYFKTTDYKDLKVTREQGELIGKNIEFVNGSDFHNNYYKTPDKNLKDNILVRYYQIASFDEFGKCAIRSFLFKGETSKGACFFDYKIKELKDYKLSKNKIDEFVQT